MHIKKLSEEVQSLIRTGINISSVSQCVLELVLNSLDAGATRVGVRIDLNKYQLQVVDDGTGLNKEELNLIGNRYMTSKCSSVTDFKNNLKFFGFRGEALASIRNTCDTLLIFSKPIDGTTTYCKVMKSGDKECAHASKAQLDRPGHGTTVVVMNIFGNLPVRQKRLHHSIELEQIKCDLEAIALIHPQVSFTLQNDATKVVLMQTKSCTDIVQNFHQLFNLEDVSKELIYVHITEGKFKISGYISRDVVKTKRYQFVYINKRFIYKNRIHQFVNNKLRSSLYLRSVGVQKNSSNDDNYNNVTSNLKNYPIFIINIECPCSEYDISFDPKKNVVEFINWDNLFDCLNKCIAEFLLLENNVHGDCDSLVEMNEYSEILNDIVESEVINKGLCSSLNIKHIASVDVGTVRANITKNNIVVKSSWSVSTPRVTKMNKDADEFSTFSNSSRSLVHSEHILTECDECNTRAVIPSKTNSNKRTIIPVVCKDFYENNLKLLKSNIYGLHKSNTKSEILTSYTTPNNISALKNKKQSIKEYRKYKAWKDESSKIATYNTNKYKENNGKTTLLNKHESKVNEKNKLIRKSILKPSSTTDRIYVNKLKKKVTLKNSTLVSFDKEVTNKRIQLINNKRQVYKNIDVLSPMCGNSNLIETHNSKRRVTHLSSVFKKPVYTCYKNIGLDKFIESDSIGRYSPHFSSPSISVKDTDLVNKRVNFIDGENKTNNDCRDSNNLFVESVNCDDGNNNNFSIDRIPGLLQCMETLKIVENEESECSRDDMFADYSVADLISPPTIDNDLMLVGNDETDAINKVNSSQLSGDGITPESQNKDVILEKDEANVNDSSYNINNKDNLAFMYGLNLRGVASKEMNRKSHSVVNNTDTVDEDKNSPEEPVSAKRKLTLLENDTEENTSKKIFVDSTYVSIDNDTIMPPSNDNLNDFEATSINDTNEPEKLNKDLTVGWTKHMLSGDSVFIHNNTGMSRRKPATPETEYNLTSRLWFLPKGISPLQNCMLPESETLNKDRYELSTVGKNDVLNVINDVDKTYYNNVTSLTKWKYQQTVGDQLCQLNTTIKKVPAIESSLSLHDLYSFEKDDLSKAEVIGLLDHKFIITTMICSEHKFIVVFDQHAVDERIRYEALYRDYKIGDVFTSKSISQPLFLTFSENEIEIINNFTAKFEQIGVHMFVTKENQVKVGAVPTCLYKRAEKESTTRMNNKLVELTKQLIIEQLESIIKTGGAGLQIPQTIDTVISYEACRSAIKFGDELLLSTACEMMKLLSRCAMPFQCAHGRPVLAPIFNLG